MNKEELFEIDNKQIIKALKEEIIKKDNLIKEVNKDKENLKKQLKEQRIEYLKEKRTLTTGSETTTKNIKEIIKALKEGKEPVEKIENKENKNSEEEIQELLEETYKLIRIVREVYQRINYNLGKKQDAYYFLVGFRFSELEVLVTGDNEPIYELANKLRKEVEEFDKRNPNFLKRSTQIE